MRLPLQAGNSALKSLLKASALLVPGSLLTIGALALVIWAELDGDLGFWVMALPVTVLFFAWRHLQEAIEMRPADLLFEADGFRVAGGKNAGRALQWAEVSSVGLRTRAEDKKPSKPVAISNNPQVGDDPDEVVELVLGLKSGLLVIAATEDGVELPSLHELAGALENGRTLSTQPAETHEVPPEVLRCPQCQAPARPSVQPTTRCGFCQAEVPQPPALREKMRAAQLESRRPARLVRSVLRQPRAGVVGAMFAFSALFMLAAWPVALGVLLLNYSRDALRFATVGWLVLFLLACLLGFFAVIRGWLTDRHALRTLATGFTALKPKDPRAPLQCRICFGPLPEDKPQALVRCAYCAAPNLLAEAFAPRTAQLEDERDSLERALKVRTSERRRWRGAALAGALLVVLSGWALRQSLSAPAPVPAVDRETEPAR